VTGTDDVVETVLAVPDYERGFLRNVHLRRDMNLPSYYCNRNLFPWDTQTKSRLQKGGVGLLETMRQQISKPVYAFLFARQTSIRDEEVSDEAIHLAAETLNVGYRGVWKKLLRRARRER